MRFGLFGINFGPCADPALAIRVAVAAEEADFESVWTGEHVAMPIRDNPVPTPPETPLLDSLIALANVAAHTRRIRLGTGILVLPHHNPVLLAKALTTLDLVSGAPRPPPRAGAGPRRRAAAGPAAATLGAAAASRGGGGPPGCGSPAAGAGRQAARRSRPRSPPSSR